MSKHTPGPWEWDDNFPKNLSDMDADAWHQFFKNNVPWLVNGNNRVLYGEIQCKNKHDITLIAAAPDLLSALVEAVELIETISPMEGDTLRRARAAIAKAVGHNA